jgi:signal transduction histidine kinase
MFETSSEMGALISGHDWARTPLGPIAGWPTSLRTIVSVALTSRFPMLVWWGPDLLHIYNDGYRQLLGDKHPASLGAPARVVWSEIWDVVGPMAEGVLRGGPATWSEHLHLAMNRRGYVEETYFTFSYSPVPDDSARIAGVLVTVKETTAEVQDERQLRMLRDLAAAAATVTSIDEACREASAVLARNDADLPFAAIYLLDANEPRATLAAAAGLDGYLGPGAPPEVALDDDGAAWPLAEAARSGRPVRVDDVRARVGAMPGGRWGEAPESAMVVPLMRAGQARPYGFLVAGATPRRALDERYVGLFGLAADHVATAMANARAHEEERLRAERLAELDRQKSAFFSNVSHELRTPLTLILSPVEEARARGVALDGESLASVHRNALRLQRLVSSLLDFSRIEAGRMQAALEPVDLAALTGELASQFRAAIERAGLRLVVELAPLPAPVVVDPRMWEQIVLNLLSNALKFTFEGTITVGLAARGDSVELTVRDTGVGVPAEAVPRLFERFFRVAGARARTHEGTGIGLALVAELAKLHGGGVRVESEVGVGTTFVVSIAARRAAVEGEPEVRRSATGQGAAFVAEALRWTPEGDRAGGGAEAPAVGEGARVLVVDDNADLRDYVRRLLVDEGLAVDTASDGEAALESARRAPPDLIVCDVMMPRLDGFGLLAALRADRRTREVPVLMLSARAGEEARADGIEAGAEDYLSKPFSARELVARARAQIALGQRRRESERERARLFDLVTQTPAVIAATRGPEHRLTLSNARHRALLGGADSIGRPLAEALSGLRGRAEVLAAIERAYTTGEPVAAPALATSDASGAERFFDWYATPIHDRPDARDGGRPDGVLAFAYDVTALVLSQRRAEAAEQAAEQASRAKDEFLAMLGHELRNPLAPILTATQLLRMRGRDVAPRESAIIERQVAHLIRLVDDLLDVSRITRGVIELKRRRLEVADTVAQAVEAASPLLDERRHRLTIAVPRGLVVDGDEARVRQIVANLIMNAAKYTEPGGAIAISAQAVDDGRAVELAVRDTGIGIEPEVLPRIFDLFVQGGRQALDRAQGGLGIGLALVRRLVALHGGTVRAHSDGRGKGSTFVVRLPSAAAPGTGPEAHPSRAARRPAESGLRLLLVDDNEDAAQLLGEVLRELGHEVTVVFDGVAALAAASTAPADVALVDIGLPVMDGYELGRRLRELPSPPRVVALTGYGQDVDRRRTRAAGFEAHFVKPIDAGASTTSCAASDGRRRARPPAG